MVNIILYGDLNDKKITNLLIDKLEGQYNITHITKGKINSYLVANSSDEILILETQDINIIESSKTIIIFKNNITDIKNLKIENNAKVIVYSQNFKAIEFLVNSNLTNIITFGYKSTDSLTSSSFDGDMKMISLQRQIQSVNGNVVEPFEFTIEQKLDLLTSLPVYGAIILLSH